MFDDSDPLPVEPIASSVDDADPEAIDPNSVLVRLHGTLSDLDRAIYETMRAIDAALGRAATEDPKRPLPLQELTTLREHMRRTRARHESHDARHSIIDIAGEPPAWAIGSADEQEEEVQPRAGTDSTQEVTVAPSGPLRVD